MPARSCSTSSARAAQYAATRTASGAGASRLGARCAANSPPSAAERRADRVDDDQRPHRRARGEHRGCRAHPTAQTARSCPGAGPDGSLLDRPGGRRPVGRGAVGRAGVVQPGPAAAEVEQDRGGHDRHPLVRFRADRPARAGLVHRGRHPVGGRQPEHAAAGEHHGVDGGDQVARVEQVGLAGARPTTAHVDPADRAGRRHDDGHPGQPARLVTGGVADAHAGDVGDRVVGSGLHGPSMTDAGPAGAGPASGRGVSDLSGA